MDQDKISKLLKKLRKDNKLTQDDLAKKLNVTPQAVSKWETGKSIPDIGILKEISEIYNIDINDLLDGNNKRKKYPIIITIILIVVFLIGIVYLNSMNDFELKNLSTTCSNFTLNGSAAFNSKKTSISITNISYCGKENNQKYESITCDLYSGKKLVKSFKEGKNITINDYVKGLTIEVDDYSNVCKNLNDLKIELKASRNNTHTLYTIPIKIKESC